MKALENVTSLREGGGRRTTGGTPMERADPVSPGEHCRGRHAGGEVSRWLPLIQEGTVTVEKQPPFRGCCRSGT